MIKGKVLERQEPRLMHPDFLLITQEIIDVLAREAEENTETTRSKMTLSASFFFSYRYR